MQRLKNVVNPQVYMGLISPSILKLSLSVELQDQMLSLRDLQEAGKFSLFFLFVVVFHLFYPFRCLYIDCDNVLLLFSVRHIVIHGTEYRPGCVLRLQEMDDIGNDFPIYGQVEEIIIWEDEKFFIATKLETLSFHKQYMAYELKGRIQEQLFHGLIYHGMEYLMLY